MQISLINNSLNVPLKAFIYFNKELIINLKIAFNIYNNIPTCCTFVNFLLFPPLSLTCLKLFIPCIFSNKKIKISDPLLGTEFRNKKCLLISSIFPSCAIDLVTCFFIGFLVKLRRLWYSVELLMLGEFITLNNDFFGILWSIRDFWLYFCTNPIFLYIIVPLTNNVTKVVKKHCLLLRIMLKCELFFTIQKTNFKDCLRFIYFNHAARNHNVTGSNFWEHTAQFFNLQSIPKGERYIKFRLPAISLDYYYHCFLI